MKINNYIYILNIIIKIKINNILNIINNNFHSFLYNVYNNNIK